MESFIFLYGGIKHNYTKQLVKLLSDSDVKIACYVEHNPNYPWSKIWELANNAILDNKLKDLQWRLAHDILYTGSKIKKWGMGEGICPMASCSCVESVDHIFRECPKVRPILSWLSCVLKFAPGSKFGTNTNSFLYGFPEIEGPKAVFNRMWFVVCVTKLVLWRSRCLHVFESKLHPTNAIILAIINHIEGRVKADKQRYSDMKFDKVWISGNSFVSFRGGKLFFRLHYPKS